MWKYKYRTVCQIVFCAVVALAISTVIAAVLGIKITSTVVHPTLAMFIMMAVHIFWGVFYSLCLSVHNFARVAYPKHDSTSMMI